MSLRLAKKIIFIFHPALMVIYIGLYFILSDLSYNFYVLQTYYLVGIFLLGYLIFPLSVIYLMQKIGYISSIYFPEKQDKTISYLIFGLFYYISYRILGNMEITPTINIVLLLPLLILLMILMIHIFYTISPHALFMGACIGLFVGFGYQMNINFLYIILVLLFLCAWIFSAQLILNKYNPTQIYSGFLIGMSSFILLFIFILHG